MIPTKWKLSKWTFVLQNHQNMKKIFTILLLLCGAFIMEAGAQKVNYTVVSDNPDRLKYTSLSLEPFYADIHMSNMTLGWNVRADAIILKRIELRADYRRAYMDMNVSAAESQSQYHAYAKNGVKFAQTTELGASLIFRDKTKRKSLRVVLSQYRFGNYQITNFINVPGNVRRMTALRGGAYLLSTSIEFTDDHQEFVKLPNVDRNKPEMALKVANKAIPMMRTGVLYAGLSFKSITSLTIDADGYGNRHNRGYTDFFVDFLFAPIVNFSDVKDTKNEVFEIDPASAAIKRMGWRAGAVFRSPETVALTYKFEFGSRPGFQYSTEFVDNQKAYLLMTIGINIPMRIKKLDTTNN